MTYLVIAPADAGWHIPFAEFEQRLRVRWPDAKVEHLAGGELDFELEVDDELVSGTLGTDGNSLALAYSDMGCAKVAIWFRSIAPPQQRLSFCDEEFSAEVALHPDTVPEELLEPFLDGA